MLLGSSSQENEDIASAIGGGYIFRAGRKGVFSTIHPRFHRLAAIRATTGFQQRLVVTRCRIALEQLRYSSSAINLRLATVLHHPKALLHRCAPSKFFPAFKSVRRNHSKLRCKFRRWVWNMDDRGPPYSSNKTALLSHEEHVAPEMKSGNWKVLRDGIYMLDS
jgi:hypothetical protein